MWAWRLFAAVALAAVWFSAPARGEGPVFKAGFAERVITPELGLEQPGGYGKAFHRVKHDDCKVRAAVFDDGTTQLAVVGVDALALRTATVRSVRTQISARCGLPPEAVLIGASHTHSGGPTCMILPGEFDHASPEVQRLAYEKSSTAQAEYLNLVERQLVEAVVEAHARRADCLGNVGYGLAENVAFNRRFKMKGGGTMTHPGQGNPDIIEPAGPVDPQVGVLGAWNASGQLAGCVVNFACHATTGPGGTSADYVHYVEQTIRGTFGEHVVVVFLAGMAGDVTQVDNRAPRQFKQFGEEAARRLGGTVGAEAVKVLVRPERGPLVPLAVASKTLTLPRRVPNAQRVARAQELVKQEGAIDGTEWTFAKETVLLDALLKKEPTAEVEVQALQVGPAVFCSSPAEYFCQFGLEIKAGSGFACTFPVSLANGCVGYVPTLAALSPGGGGYETRLTSYSNLVPTAGDTIARTAIELARKFQPGTAPALPALPAFTGKPWGYGSVPPELE